MTQISTRFSVGVHILAMLAICKDCTNTSDFIAGSVNTNPVVIRRLTGLLKKAGLVHTSTGIAGATLAKPPEEITLLDIYRAVGAAKNTLFDVHQHTNEKCPVGANIQSALADTLEVTQRALERELESKTLADIVNSIRKRS